MLAAASLQHNFISGPGFCTGIKQRKECTFAHVVSIASPPSRAG
jgi:hypothetical protein